MPQVSDTWGVFVFPCAGEPNRLAFIVLKQEELRYPRTSLRITIEIRNRTSYTSPDEWARGGRLNAVKDV